MRNIYLSIVLFCFLSACSSVHKMSSQMEKSNQLIETNSATVTKSSEIIQTNTQAVIQSTDTLKDLKQVVESSTSMIQQLLANFNAHPYLFSALLFGVPLLFLFPSIILLFSYRRVIAKIDRIMDLHK